MDFLLLLMGYEEVKKLYKKEFHKSLRNSWIANILNDHGKTHNKAASRKGNYKYPCPKDVKPKLTKILKELQMI